MVPENLHSPVATKTNVGVQSSYVRYINYKKMINAREAVAGFLWATAIVEKPQLEQLKKK